MRVPLKLLAEYVPLTLPPEELARRLTLSVAEVEAILRVGGDWDDRVRVAIAVAASRCRHGGGSYDDVTHRA